MITNKIVVSVFSFSVVLLSACATSNIKPVTNNDDLAMQSSDAPLGPPGVFSTDRRVSEGGEIFVKSEAEQGVEATVSKMINNRLTLYWREQNAYTYSIGDAFEARYKPDDGLTLQDQSNPENQLVCKYSLSGELSPGSSITDNMKAQQKSCADLMFTFDNQLVE